jgi:hypothetical protein
MFQHEERGTHVEPRLQHDGQVLKGHATLQSTSAKTKVLQANTRSRTRTKVLKTNLLLQHSSLRGEVLKTNLPMERPATRCKVPQASHGTRTRRKVLVVATLQPEALGTRNKPGHQHDEQESECSAHLQSPQRDE